MPPSTQTRSPVRAPATPPVPMTLDRITRGKIAKPRRIVVHGRAKTGKSTFGSEAPSPIFIGPESGTENLDVARFPEAQSWTDIISALDTLQVGGHPFKTLVLDTVDWIEPLAHRVVMARDGSPTIEKAAGGYGKGYGAALDLWRALLVRLDALRNTGMTILLLAHSEVKSFKNPSGADYDRWEMKCHKSVAGLLGEWADIIGFAQHEDVAVTDEKKRSRAGWTGCTWLYLQRSAAFDAGNRDGLPDRVELEWAAFAEALAAGTPDPPEKLRAAIEEIARELPEDVAEKVRGAVSRAGDDGQMLARILGRARTRLTDNNQ